MAAQNKTGRVACMLTHQEVAEVLSARGYPMTAKIAWHLERRALRKIGSDPVVQRLAEELGLRVKMALPRGSNG